uniref:Sushi domain-containing protein n=1 Tax=Terrapene triunguis TaxID=2587831 RepID=A0A674JSM6_9SAUR
DSYTVGTKLKYSCRPGYMLGSGKSPYVTCLANSTWSVDPEFCVGEFLRCFSISIDVYRLIGPTSARCVVVGNGVDWDKELSHCEAIPCRPPPDITNGSHTGQSEQQFLYGSAVTYKCDQGFSLIGEATIHCTMKNNVDGEWSGPAPECKVVRCPEPEVKNGKKQSGFGPDYSYGNTVIFECDSGYTLNGSSSVKCEANNSWVPSLPTCLRKYKQLLQPAYRPRDIVVFECDPGYTLSGSSETQCQDDGRWDPPVPVCERSNRLFVSPLKTIKTINSAECVHSTEASIDFRSVALWVAIPQFLRSPPPIGILG